MSSFRRFAFVTTLATYFLIFVGGLVRVSGAGLGCPDWPRCFGRWIPPTSLDQLPAGIDPAQFNLTLAWIEYLNRLTGVVVGLLIASLAVWALVRHRTHRWIVVPAAAAALLTAFQGWQGSVVVASELQPMVVSVHTVLALVIVSLLIAVTFEAYQLETHGRHRSQVTLGARTMVGLLWLAAIVQVLFGALLRGAIESVAADYPLMLPGQWIGLTGGVSHIHLSLGILVVAYVFVVVATLWRHRDRLSPVMNQASLAVLAVACGQFVLGMSFLVIDIAPMLQVFHLWLGALLVGLALLMFMESRVAARS